MGTNAKNTQMAYLYGKALASLSSDKRTIINYYISEDAAANTRAEEITFDIPSWMQIKAFGSTLSSYFKAIRSLGQRSLKLAYLYDKLSNPRISIEQTARNFVDDEYNQRSSCASALHLKYKLASVGISPKTNTKSVIVPQKARYAHRHSARIGASAVDDVYDRRRLYQDIQKRSAELWL